MGDPKKARKKYRRPDHPWQRTRIEIEGALQRNYGLKNKNEIWRTVFELGRLGAHAKKLIREKGKGNKQVELEEGQLLDRLIKYGLIKEGDSLDSVLTLKPEDFLNRRLQTIVHKTGMALSASQARQFVTHGHILVNGNKVTVPSYLVVAGDEIRFNESSKIADPNHPERSKEKKARVKAEEKEASEKEAAEITEEELEKIEKEIVVEAEA